MFSETLQPSSSLSYLFESPPPLPSSTRYCWQMTLQLWDPHSSKCHKIHKDSQFSYLLIIFLQRNSRLRQREWLKVFHPEHSMFPWGEDLQPSLAPVQALNL